VSNHFPFHKFCSFCTDHCIEINTESDYLLITNFWNEKPRIEPTIRRIGRQTKQPKAWLWIDDGSTDGSRDEIERLAEKVDNTLIWIESMPLKKRGNLDTIGRAYQKILPKYYDKIDELDVKYVAIMDVDTEPCPNYFSRIIWLMDRHPDIGAAAGAPIGEEGLRKVGLPMGGGKIIRWSIMREIKKYWDLAPDTLLNIKALAKGFMLKTWKVPMRLERLTTSFSSKGVFRLGRINYYVGRPFWAALFRALRRCLVRQHGSQMLRGYLMEYLRGTWRFQDTDVAWYYRRGSNPISALIDIISYIRIRE
jgi:glycosyltransferase involved in cell wall biosynthesis